MKRFILSMAVAVGVLCGFQRAQASLLAPGGSVAPVPSGTLPAGDTLVISTGLETISSLNGVTATLTENVYRETGGTLDFTYTLSDSSASPSTKPILGFSLADYTGSSTDVSYTAGTQPSGATRTTLGDTLTFSFGGKVGSTTYPSLGPGGSTTLLIETKSTNYSSATGSANFNVKGGGATLSPPTPHSRRSPPLSRRR